LATLSSSPRKLKQNKTPIYFNTLIFVKTNQKDFKTKKRPNKLWLAAATACFLGLLKVNYIVISTNRNTGNMHHGTISALLVVKKVMLQTIKLRTEISLSHIGTKRLLAS
jgi:hypothetical protein